MSDAQGRLVNEVHAHEVYPHEMHAHEMHAHEVHTHETLTNGGAVVDLSRSENPSPKLLRGRNCVPKLRP